jgi:hypothetical protein
MEREKTIEAQKLIAESLKANAAVFEKFVNEFDSDNPVTLTGIMNRRPGWDNPRGASINNSTTYNNVFPGATPNTDNPQVFDSQSGSQMNIKWHP